MRVLQLTPELPSSPGGSGGMTRQFHLVRRLIELGHDVSVIASVNRATEGGVDSLRAVGADVEPVRRPDSEAGAFLRGVAVRPALLVDGATDPLAAWKMAFFWQQLRPRVLRAIERQPPDVVLVEHDYSAGWQADLPPAIPAVLDCHNASPAYYRSRARVARGPRRVLLGLEARRFARHDARRLPGFAALVAVSEHDRADLATLVPTPCWVVPNGVAVDEVLPLSEGSGPASVLFTGTMSHPPNAEAARWFVREIWPSIRRALPQAELVLAGRDPPAAVRRLDDVAGVRVTGAVPDMQPYLRDARVVVVPMRSGGGTRLKVLEAFAAGRAVVSTTAGLEGIEGVQPDQQAVLANEAAAFAAAVTALLEDGERRARMAAAARRLVVERYDWRALGDAFGGVLAEAVANARLAGSMRKASPGTRYLA